LFSASVFLCPHLSTQAQGRGNTDPSIPAELTPADPEIRELLHVGDESCKAADPAAWMEKVEKALQIAEARGLVGDKALVEAYLASTLITQGNLDQAFTIFRKALQDSMDAKREVLEADILISLASEAQMRGNSQEALGLVTRALSLAEKTGNLYGKARALGELGRLNLILGKHDEASRSIDEALNIDRLNGYKFQALHLVYKGYLLGLAGRDDQAIETMEQARAKALATKDSYSFLLAENSFTFGLARKGKPDEAIRQMDLLLAGDLSEFVHDTGEKSCLAASLEFPIFRILLLEGFTNVLEAANQKEREINIWQELFSISEKQGILAGQAEAKQKIADLENQLKRTDQALKDYAAAADLYSKLGNDALRDQVQIAEAVLLVNSGRGKEAIPIAEEIASYAKSHNLRQLEFRAYITLAGVFQQAGEPSKAQAAFEKAISLVHPRPFDEELDNQMIHMAYVSLSDIYRALANVPKELIAIDQAFFVSVHLKDEKAQQREVNYLDHRLNELHVRKLVEERQKADKLTEALIYSYVLYLRDGHPEKPAEDANWQRILTLPFQISQKPGGASELTEILNEIGPILGLEKLPMLDALARYYIAAGSDPGLAEKYAKESENVVNALKGDQTALRVESTCVIAIAYSR